MTEQSEGERLYILGHPVAHSKSPVMYNALYEKLGLPWTYALADYAELDDARAFLDARDFLSVNITTPYKPLAFQTATRKAASAQLAQGANVLVRKDDQLIGFNTDGDGCVKFLELAGVTFKGKRVVVCGTGPTALSILHACAIAGADVLLLLSRDKERARSVLDAYLERFCRLANATIDFPAMKEGHRSFREAYTKPTFKFGSYTTSAGALGSADIIINATPVGMKPDDLRIPYAYQEAKKRGLEFTIDTVELRDAHPNTAVIETWDAGGKKLELQACSVGGGRILVNKVDGIDVSFDGMFNTLVIRNQDENGAVAAVTSVLNQLRINVANMSLCRHKRGGDALMVIETDQHIKPHQVAFLSELTGILSVTYYDKEDDDDVAGFDEGNL